MTTRFPRTASELARRLIDLAASGMLAIGQVQSIAAGMVTIMRIRRLNGLLLPTAARPWPPAAVQDRIPLGGRG